VHRDRAWPQWSPRTPPFTRETRHLRQGYHALRAVIVTGSGLATTRAQVLAQRGELAAGKALASEAVAFAAESDFLDSHGDALMSLTDVLQLADRLDDAGTALDQAASLYAQQGNIVSAAKARARLESISPV